MKTTSFFLFIFLTFSLIPAVFGQTVTVTSEILPQGEAGFEDDEIILDNDETLDLSQTVETVPETTETIGGQEVELTQEVQFVSNTPGQDITLENTELETVTVAIPDNTKISAPAAWNGEITPPKSISTSGSVAAGFQTPSTSIQVGSPDVILVFDEAVTILLEDTTGQTAYKTPGSSTWILISGCTGTYENPDDPPENGECSISDGVDTKILTFHFTEFTDLTPDTPDTPDTPSTSSTSSSGSGKTGIGSPRVFGPSSSGSSGGGYYPPGETKQTIFPAWFDNVNQWYREGKISLTEFLNAYQWVTENIIK